MDNDYTYDLYYLLQTEHLRLEALNLYEHCLAQQEPQQLERFIEQQLESSPPPLYLLQRIADDVQQRLASLEAHYFDARRYVVELLDHAYNLDISELMRFHEVSSAAILANIQHPLDATERNTLRQTLLISREIGYQLQRDIDITKEILQMITDWKLALSVDYARANPHWHTGIVMEPDVINIH